jgi:cytochrome c553
MKQLAAWACISLEIAAVCVVPTTAPAQNAASPPGRLLASNCSQCHGTSEQAPGFDKLTGKSAAKLYKELKEYQSGKEGENIMARHAMGFTDAQLRDLSRWLSLQP